jgi:hypothetical protein
MYFKLTQDYAAARGVARDKQLDVATGILTFLNPAGEIDNAGKPTQKYTVKVGGENFTGSAVYNIRYLASLCIPVEKTQIICKIENINNAIILATHGPISCVITPDNINTLIFVNEIGKYYYNLNDSRNELKKGDLVKLTVLSKKLYKNTIYYELEMKLFISLILSSKNNG